MIGTATTARARPDICPNLRPDADAIMRRVRDRFGAGNLGLRAIDGSLLVTITDRAGTSWSGRGVTWVAAIQDLLEKAEAW